MNINQMVAYAYIRSYWWRNIRPITDRSSLQWQIEWINITDYIEEVEYHISSLPDTTYPVPR